MPLRKDASDSICVVGYDPDWPRVFERLRRPIAEVLCGRAFEIEHVGSTSVPGLAAKPIIDMDVIVPSPAEVEPTIRLLSRLGYVHAGDGGIPGRERLRAPETPPAHHLYVCAQGCVALVNHLAVRDHLRAHPEEAAEYGRLKRRLAEFHATDIDGYVEGKSAFLRSILARVGLSAADLDSIEAQNRRPGT